jgi:hypothetical protein
MDDNPYKAPAEAERPRKSFPWIWIILCVYVVCAVVAYSFVDYRTAHTKYNDSVGGLVIWSAIFGGILLWLLLRRLFPVQRSNVAPK